MERSTSLRACPACARVHAVPWLERDQRARCTRCGAEVADGRGPRLRAERAWYAACAALILYPLAVGLPILRLEQLGHVRESSVLSGSLGLVADGHAALGALVFLCSIVIPVAKLLTLVLLLRRSSLLAGERRAYAWRALEACGRFGMLDVLLVSILVAWVELGSWVQVSAGPAATAFGACVGFSLLASAWFDPHDL